MSVRRLYVEKRQGFDVQAQKLCADLKDPLPGEKNSPPSRQREGGSRPPTGGSARGYCVLRFTQVPHTDRKSVV